MMLYKGGPQCNVRKIDLDVIGTSRGMGRLEKTWIKSVRNDYKTLNLTDKITLDWTEWKRKIHVGGPVNSD